VRAAWSQNGHGSLDERAIAASTYDAQEANRVSKAHPIYRTIEFCRNANTLWGKIESGRWDWLGVHPDGKFVLGSPAQARSRVSAAASVVRAGAEAGRFDVKIYTPDGPGPSVESLPTNEAARAAFEAECVRLAEGDRPCLYRVTLVLDGVLTDEEFVVTLPPTYNLPPGRS
jgi:hypothetical protein